jgi:hypothetical protein
MNLPMPTAGSLPPMSNNQRAKLKRFVRSIDFTRDLTKAAANARVSKKLLDNWMRTPEISQRIANLVKKKRRGEALLLVNHAKVSSKIGPFSLKVRPGKPTQLDDMDWGNWLPMAKSAAQSFKRCKDVEVFTSLIEVVLSTKSKQLLKQFFIDLGKCLSGEIHCEQWDTLDLEVADIILEDRSISAKSAVRELEHRGFHNVTEDLFRMRKKRLGLSKAMRSRVAKSPKA